LSSRVFGVVAVSCEPSGVTGVRVGANGLLFLKRSSRLLALVIETLPLQPGIGKVTEAATEVELLERPGLKDELTWIEGH
jgi:hypothetical protein